MSSSERRARLSPEKLALLEKRLRRVAAQAGEGDAGSVVPRPDGGPAPASFGQRRLFHLAESRPESLAYHLYHVVGLRGPLDPGILERSLWTVTERHEASRTRFDVAEGGEVLTIVSPQGEGSSSPWIDLSGLPDPASREAEGLRIVTELTSLRFDLRRGPLLRTALLRLAPEEHSLLLAGHHAVLDGWSLALFARELAEAYEALAGGGRPSWPAVLQAADFASWQRRRVREGALDESLVWWRRHLSGASPEGLSWPVRPQVPGGRGSWRIGPEVTRDLKALAQRERATLFMALLAGFTAVLRQRTGQSDLIVGTPAVLRSGLETAGVFGFLLNVLPLRIDLSGDPTFLDLLRQTREVFLGAFAHREAPVEWLAEKLAPGHDPGAVPWTRVLFNMPAGEAGHSAPLKVRGLELLPLATGELRSEFDLTFYAREVAGGIRLDLGFNANLFAPGEAGRLLEGFAALLGEAASSPDRRLSELAERVLTPAGSEV